MGFPIILPTFYNELAEQMKPAVPEEFCDINITTSAVEYAPMLCFPEAVKLLIAEKDVLAYNMVNMSDEESESFIEQSRMIIEAHPVAQYYWQIRSLFMGILQNRNINFEKRILLLNYALKTVQGMTDGGQPELIPRFADGFIADGTDYDKIIEYFKEVRPNPAYSLADGISLLKSLDRSDPAYKDVMNTIYKNLGVSGPETLKMADMKKYIGLRGKFSEWLGGEKASYIENVMINYVWSYSLPFCEPEFNFWDHFVFFCSLYNAIKVMLTCYMAEYTDEEFIKAVSSFDKALRASDPRLMGKVIMAVKNAGQSNNGDLAILTLS